jgi:hypothetical protein
MGDDLSGRRRLTSEVAGKRVEFQVLETTFLILLGKLHRPRPVACSNASPEALGRSETGPRREREDPPSNSNINRGIPSKFPIKSSSSQ